MNMQWTDRFKMGTVMLMIGSMGSIAIAQPAQDVAATRTVETEAMVSNGLDGFPTNQAHSSFTSTQPTGLFDETAQVNVTAPNSSAEVTGHASHVSDINFVTPHLLHITGELNVTQLAQGTSPNTLQNDNGFAQVDQSSQVGFNFQMTTELPVVYEVSGHYEFEFENPPVAPNEGLLVFRAFDVSDLILGGAGGSDTFQFSGTAPGGEHTVLFSLVHSTFGFIPPGELLGSGHVTFDVTARIIPTPAAVGPGLVMLVALLLRRRQSIVL